MSFDNINEITNNTLNVKIDLSQKEITNIQTRNPQFINYSFFGNNKTPTVIINNTHYVSHNLFIWKGRIHNIPSIDYDAECIIETIYNNQKCFVCFLLKSAMFSSNADAHITSIDKLWNITDNTSAIPTTSAIPITMEIPTTTLLDLNQNEELNGENLAIYYKNGIHTVIINLKPIIVKSDLKTTAPYPKCFLMEAFNKNYEIIQINPINAKGDVIENFDLVGLNGNVSADLAGINLVELTEQGLYLDCSPTSQSTATLDTLTVPLDKQGNINLSKSLFFTSIMNCLIIVMIFMAALWTMPSFYKYCIVSIIEQNSIPDKSTRLKTVSYFMFIILLIFAVALILDGLSGHNVYEFYAGFIALAFVLFSCIVLFIFRNSPGYSFQKVYNWNPIDIWDWLSESYSFFKDNSHGVLSVFFGIIIVFGIALTIPILMRPEKILPDTDTQIHALTVVVGFLLPYSIILSPFIFLLYKTMSKTSRPNELNIYAEK